MVMQATRRVATYERVSSEDQRDRETIKAQTEELARRLDFESDVELTERYVDDGVSGTIPMTNRPGGARLLEDAARGRFDEVWVYKIDRLGRDDVDPLIVWRDLEALGVKVHSVTEGVSTLFEYHIRVAMAAEERRTFLERTAAGIKQAVKDGRFPGGIVPYGYTLQGVKRHARLLIDDTPVWGDASAADIVRFMFEASADGWSDRRIADDLNRRGVPTAYNIAGRAVKEKNTQNIWRQGRVGQILKNTTYYGEYRYGKNSTKGNEITSGPVPAIVSKELWDTANERRRLRARKPADECRRYDLRSLIKCGICGLNYSGTISNDDVWYRCNGQMVARGPLGGRCTTKSIKGMYIEPVVRGDIEAWLLSPGETLDELAAELERQQDGALATHEAERITLTERQRALESKIERLIDLYVDSGFKKTDIERRRVEYESQLRDVRARLEELDSIAADDKPIPPNLHEELRRRLPVLKEDEWREILQLLVRQIRVQTTVDENGKKHAKVIIEYRFSSVANNYTDTREGQDYTVARRVVRL